MSPKGLRSAAVAARVAPHLAAGDPALPVGIVPLNPGFFRLERIRSSAGARGAGLPAKKVSTR